MSDTAVEDCELVWGCRVKGYHHEKKSPLRENNSHYHSHSPAFPLLLESQFSICRIPSETHLTIIYIFLRDQKKKKKKKKYSKVKSSWVGLGVMEK